MTRVPPKGAMHTDTLKSDGRWAPEVAPTELSPEIISRTLKEEQENNEIYRRRSQDTLDLSRTHYGHRHMLNWAIQQLPNLNGARVLDVGVGEGQSTVLLAGAGAHVTGIDISGEALARAKKLANSCHVHPDFLQMAGEDLQF